MKAVWLQGGGRRRVLIVFAGWGMDAAPFRRLTVGDWDVLVYYDFRQLDEIPFRAEVAACPERALVAWSLGCAAANRVAQACCWSLTRAVAINGTLIPEDDHAGIPARWIEATAQHLTEGGWERFVRRMCPDTGSRTAFDAARPDRNLQGAVAELQFLRRLPAPRASVFRQALVSGTDRVILPGNQQCCWDRYAVPTCPIQGPHYPFHLWTRWEEVLACARS